MKPPPRNHNTFILEQIYHLCYSDDIWRFQQHYPKLRQLVEAYHLNLPTIDITPPNLRTAPTCKTCKFWNKGWCERYGGLVTTTEDHGVICDDYEHPYWTKKEPQGDTPNVTK